MSSGPLCWKRSTGLPSTNPMMSAMLGAGGRSDSAVSPTRFKMESKLPARPRAVIDFKPWGEITAHVGL
eukprot:8027289-Alexandrium_andersonii.AAC.1